MRFPLGSTPWTIQTGGNPHQIGDTSPEQHGIIYLTVYAPAIAAPTIVVCRTGQSGLRRYLSRLLLWRASAAWYAFLLVGVPLFFYAGAVWKGLSGAELIPVSSLGAYLGGPRAARD